MACLRRYLVALALAVLALALAMGPRGVGASPPSLIQLSSSSLADHTCATDITGVVKCWCGKPAPSPEQPAAGP